MKTCRIIILLTLVFSKYSISASFNCSEANTEMEKVICEYYHLDKLDKEMGDYYFKLKKILILDSPDRLLSEQREWLKNRNIECNDLDVSCLEDYYKWRIYYLKERFERLSSKNNIRDLLYACYIEDMKGKQGTFNMDCVHENLKESEAKVYEIAAVLENDQTELIKNAEKKNKDSCDKRMLESGYTGGSIPVVIVLNCRTEMRYELISKLACMTQNDKLQMNIDEIKLDEYLTLCHAEPR